MTVADECYQLMQRMTFHAHLLNMRNLEHRYSNGLSEYESVSISVMSVARKCTRNRETYCSFSLQAMSLGKMMNPQHDDRCAANVAAQLQQTSLAVNKWEMSRAITHTHT